ncbi:MAG: hypothetical protein AAFQ89_03825 [Cyanobacteria bacterium J06626_18]
MAEEQLPNLTNTGMEDAGKAPFVLVQCDRWTAIKLVGSGMRNSTTWQSEAHYAQKPGQDGQRANARAHPTKESRKRKNPARVTVPTAWSRE